MANAVTANVFTRRHVQYSIKLRLRTYNLLPMIQLPPFNIPDSRAEFEAYKNLLEGSLTLR